MKSQNVRVTRDLTRPEAEGVHFRLLCMTGKNKGLVYYLRGKRVVLGRSDKIDVQVLDTKSSREHAELTRFGDSYIATDLGSQNGIIINDLKVSQHQLIDGDKIIIGQTVFKFNIIVVKNELVEIDEEEDEDEDEDEDDDEEEDEEEVAKKTKKKAASPADKKKKLIYAAVAVLLVVMFIPSEPSKKTIKKQPIAAKEDKTLAEVLRNRNKDYDQETEDKIDVILHRGYRELRENNYMRAIEEFNMALILSPNHGRASASLEKSKMLLDEQVKSQFNKAKREIDSLKYQKAVRIYCSILRYLQEKPEDERYKRADKEIKAIIEEQGLRADEVKCF